MATVLERPDRLQPGGQSSLSPMARGTSQTLVEVPTVCRWSAQQIFSLAEAHAGSLRWINMPSPEAECLLFDRRTAHSSSSRLVLAWPGEQDVRHLWLLLARHEDSPRAYGKCLTRGRSVTVEAEGSGVITAFKFGPMEQCPDVSPFVTKLETWLRMAGITYESRIVSKAKMPKGKLPVIDDDGRLVADSSFIIRYLEQKHGDPLGDASLATNDRVAAWR